MIIPARYASSRFPGKPLFPLRGADGVAKSLVQRSWEAASAIGVPASVWVATDDQRIADEVAKFGGKVVMTSPDCRNGTERCAEAADKLGDVDIVVNLQGDAPLTPVDAIAPLIDLLEQKPGCAMATPAVRCSPSTYRHLVEDQRNGRVGGTTVVFDEDQRALYFSKRVIPHLPADHDLAELPVFLHLGLYAYRTGALRDYAARPPGTLELLEGLEQLRFLETGQDIAVHPLPPLGWDPIELNNPTDVAAVEAALAERGMR
ncbi:manno-octulosonate cytidylyltransferase [Sphingomonas humi]|uniref:Manno-octulosonate cytidylyltransferase n=1 Tax=Sphingomonas humi TaxID=335630 RepID=A0ABP7S351_9SPHN